MSKKFLFVLSFFLIVAAGAPVRAELVAYYPFEGDYNDKADNPANGTPMGSPTFGEGYFGQAIKLNGTSDYVNCGNPAKLNITGTKITVMCWAKTDGTWGPSSATLFAKGNAGYRLYRFTTGNPLLFSPGAGSAYAYVNTGKNINDAGWHHIAGVYDGTTIYLYIDGVVDDTTANTAALVTNTDNFWIGNNPGNTSRYWKGWIDELRIYNNALTLAEIIAAKDTPPGPNPYATAISPANGQLETPINAVLSWKAGAYAATHTVYLSTTFADVNTAQATALKSAYQSGTTYDPGILAYNTVYYWRVDEVNSPGTAGSYTYTGKVWNFTTDMTGYPIGSLDSPIGTDRIKASASSRLDAAHDPNKTMGLNNTGLKQGPGPYKAYYVDANHVTTGSANMWLTDPADPNGKWIKYVFDKEYKINNMLVWNYNETTSKAEFGILLSQFGIKDANVSTSTDYGTSWSSPVQTQLQKGTELPTYQAIDPINGNNIDMGGSIVTGVTLQAISNWSGGLYSGYGLSEVIFLVAPSYASRYTVTTSSKNTIVNTSTGTVDPNIPNSRLNWNKGRDGASFATSHKVYLQGIDNDAITNATPADPNSARNAVRDNTIAANTTTDPNYPLSGLNMQATYYWRVDEVIGAKTWMNNSTRNNYKDIQSFKTVASRLVTNYEAQSTLIGGGNFVASPTHGGSVAFRVPVDVTSGNKQIGPVDPIYYNINSNNWQAGNPAKLAIWFYGDPNNTGASMYIKLGNTKITYAGDPGRLLWAGWTRWDVPLTGVNLSSIAEVYYGVDVVGGTGLGQILFDDLTLYRLYPDVPAATKPDAANLIAYYPLNGNANDMKGFGTAYNGTATLGTPAFSTSLATYGQAADCNGTADYIDLGRPADGNVFNPAGDFSVSVWIKPTAWGTGWGHDIVANRGESPVGWQIRRGNSGNLMVFTTRGTGTTGTGPEDFYSKQNIMTNKWTHIVCVFDSVKKTKSIYIDGILDGTGDTTGNKIARTTAARTYIGCRANGDSATAGRENYFTGLIDEVRLYNSALTAAEALYLANPAPATIVP